MEFDMTAGGYYPHPDERTWGWMEEAMGKANAWFQTPIAPRDLFCRINWACPIEPLYDLQFEFNLCIHQMQNLHEHLGYWPMTVEMFKELLVEDFNKWNEKLVMHRLLKARLTKIVDMMEVAG
jgi:hypothetical protein